MAPGLSIHIGEKRFGAGEPLFSDFRLEIDPGCVVALMGPSGIGKSSLLRMIGGIDRAFTGQISIGGRDVAAAPPPGFVFQDARLLPWLSARDNVRLADPAMADPMVDSLLDRVGLGGRGEDFPAQLSGGMQRRVALARAMATKGQFLLLDEPFVSLDAKLAAEMRALLAAVMAGTEKGIVLVTHDGEDAARLADRVILLARHPAQIVGDQTFSVPAPQRDEAKLEEYRRSILSLFAMEGGDGR